MSACSTYLTFNGNCREAFDFYRNVFGGDFEFISTFENLPEQFKQPSEDADRIMHVSLKVKDSVLMGSDNNSSEPSVNFGNNFSIYVTTASIDETDSFLERMSANGTVTMPAANTFWGAYFGMCTDQFGINWMFSCSAEG